MRLLACATALATLCGSWRAHAVEIEDVGGEPFTIDITNTTVLGYHFDNRNVSGAALVPSQHVDDNYGDWFNQLYLRLYYWKLSLGVRLDSAVFFHTLDRQDAQDLVIDELGAPDLDIENQVSRELHSRYTQLVYPAKLWLGFKHEALEVTAGDFYQQLGRGLVFSVRKIDDVGVDTTVRGGKLEVKKSWEDFRVAGTLFGGQLNPIRVDFPTGRILHGTDSPVFFGFPRVDDFEACRAGDPAVDGGAPCGVGFELTRQRAKPSYLEDNVVGSNLMLGPKQVQFEVNGAILFRQSNSEEQQRCLAQVPTGDPRATEDATDSCLAELPSFNEPDAARSHDQIRNFSGAVRVPPIEDVVDGYVEAAGQQLTDGRVVTINPDGGTTQQVDVWGYAIYANVNVRASIFSFTLQGKHYRNFFPLAANVDLTTAAFGAPEYNIVNYSEPPTTESIYVEPLGSPDVCNTGGRARVDAKVAKSVNIYAWGGRYLSYTEIDPNLESEDPADPQSTQTCTPPGDNAGVSRTEARRTDTWDTASGAEIDVGKQGTHYWGWVGARFTDRAVPVVTSANEESAVFYREGYVRYDFNQHLAGDFSLSAVGYHRRRYEPIQQFEPWHEGENLLALNWNPHLAFIFGYEYQTRPGIPTHYFNGAIQYRSMDNEHWYGQLFDTIRLFVGQRRSALRCVGGVCRVYPAFEGAKLELVSRF